MEGSRELFKGLVLGAAWCRLSSIWRHLSPQEAQEDPRSESGWSPLWCCSIGGNEPANPLIVTTTQVASEAKLSQYVSPGSLLKVHHENCLGTYPGPWTGMWPVSREDPGAHCLGEKADSYRFLVPWKILPRHSSCSTKKKNTVQKKRSVGRRGRGHRLFDMSDMSLICQNRRKAKKTFILVSPFYRWANCEQKDDVCLRTSTGPEIASDEVFHRHFSSQIFICWWCPIEVHYLGGKIKIWCLKPHMGNPVLHTQPSFLPVDMLWS